MRIAKRVDHLKNSAVQYEKKKQDKRYVPRKLIIQRMITKGIRTAKTAAGEYKELNEPENPAQYASDKGTQIVRTVSSKSMPVAANGTIRIIRGTSKAGKTAFRFAKDRAIRLKVKSIKAKPIGNESHAPTAPHSPAYHAGRNRAMTAARYRGRQSAIQHMAKTSHATEAGAKAANRTVKAAQKTVKSETRSIKTARSAASTAKAAGNATRTARKATSKAVQLIKIAEKAAATTAKLVVKAIIAAGKALVAAAQAITAFLAAGGGLVVLIVNIIALIAYLFGSAFGIFFTDEAESGALTQAVIDIQIDFTTKLQEEIDGLSSAGAYDAVAIHYDGDFDGDSFMANNWTDVLVVYAVKMQFDGSEVLSMSPEKQRILQQIFLNMNPVEYRTEVETETYEERIRTASS